MQVAEVSKDSSIFESPEVAAVVIAAVIGGLGWLVVRRVTTGDKKREERRNAAQQMIGELQGCKLMVFGLDAEWSPNCLAKIVERLPRELGIGTLTMNQLKVRCAELASAKEALPHVPADDDVRAFNSSGAKLQSDLRRLIELYL